MHKVSERVVEQLVNELEDLTGEKFEVVDPNEKWWNGLCFDTSALMLWKMLGMFESSISQSYNHYDKHCAGERNFYLLYNGLSQNIGRLNPNFYKLDDASEQEVEDMMNL